MKSPLLLLALLAPLGLSAAEYRVNSPNGKLALVVSDDAGLRYLELAGNAPDKAESFQWINLMRGDTALMSLVNHRYLTTKPNKPGQATADATGPSPARKNGECFKWKAVE
jgi:hypothetical protein